MYIDTPEQHLRKIGCKYCTKDHLHDIFSKTNEQFINEANIIHHNLYTYNFTNYKNLKEKII